MNEPTTDTASVAAPRAGYAKYLKAWITLLVITIVMVFVSNPAVILVGICVKVSIIAAVFMHLKDETLDFVFIIAFSIVFFAALLFGLIARDGMAM